MSRILSALVGLMVILAAACGGRQSGEVSAPAERDSDIIVQVINNGFQDADIYAYTGAGGRLLGMAPGHRISVFRVAWHDLGVANRFRVAADPIGRPDRVFSDHLHLRPGSLITWTLQPNLESSTLAVY